MGIYFRERKDRANSGFGVVQFKKQLFIFIAYNRTLSFQEIDYCTPHF